MQYVMIPKKQWSNISMLNSAQLCECVSIKCTLAKTLYFQLLLPIEGQQHILNRIYSASAVMVATGLYCLES